MFLAKNMPDIQTMPPETSPANSRSANYQPGNATLSNLHNMAGALLQFQGLVIDSLTIQFHGTLLDHASGVRGAAC